MSSKHKDNLHILRSILIESLPRENLPLDIEYGVNNNMTDQVNENTSRPGSAQNAPPLLLKTPSKADQQRLEKIQQLREKQNSDRLKKLEELKLHAAAASKLREEQDTRRRRHFLELSKKDSERRQAAEERRQQLEKERMSALTARFESKRMNASMTASMMSQPRSNDRKYAFGSCTPRLIENMDGFLWKSQYNLNLNPPPGAGTSDNKQGRATSAQDLLAGNDDGGSQSRLYFFCGRRKTDLTPTIPIRRDMQSPRSTTTSDLDIRVHNHSGFARTPSPGPRNILHQRSKSTNQLFKLTRTELLRQERAKKREGFSSTMSTRPPSSLSAANTSVMTSSAHSGVNINMRSRPAARKPRPVSVHVTGISSNTPTTAGAAMDEKRFSKIEEKNLQKSSSRTPTTTTTTPRPRVSAANATTTAEQKSAKSPSPTTEEKSSSLSSTSNNNKKDFITSTIKRGTTPKPKKTTETTSKSNNNNITSNGVAVVVKDEGGIATKRQQAPPQHPLSGGGENVSTSKSIIVDSVTDKSDSDEKAKSATISVLEQDNAVVPNNSAVVVEPEIEQAVKVNGLSKGEGDEEEKVGVIETVVVANNNNGVREQNGERGDVILNNNLNNNNYNNDNTPGGGDGDNMSTSTTTTATPTTTATEQNEEMLLIPSNKTPKLSNEQQAKAALAEKRRLAREAQEKEAARLEELARQEEERQREEAELAERLLEESKKAEEERLMKAIREREQREEEERKRQIEEENSRLEKEQADKEAAREVERLRLEMEERLRREEIERVERRRRVEAIMSRTRVANRKNQENKQDNLQEEEDSASVIPTTKSDPTTIMNLQNSNFNNNTTTSTLISFDDNEFNCNTNNRTVQQEEQIDGAFRTSAMEGSTTSGSAEIQDLLS